MVIHNINELVAHMESIGCVFRKWVTRTDAEQKFDRYVGGEKAAKNVDTWLRFLDEDLVELGADYEGDPEIWFSDEFVFPFESVHFDQYLFACEGYAQNSEGGI